MPFARPIERAPALVLTTSEFEAMGQPARFERSRHTPMPSRQPIFARGGADVQPTHAFSRIPPAPVSTIAPVSADRSGPQFVTAGTRVARERSAFLRALVLMASGASVGVLLAMIAQPRLDAPAPRAAAQPQDTGVARIVAPVSPPAAATAPPRVSRGMVPPRRTVDPAPSPTTPYGTTITTTVTKRDANGGVIVEAPVTVAPPPPPPKATGKARGGIAPRGKQPPVTKSTLTPRAKLGEKDEDLLQRAKDTETL